MDGELWESSASIWDTAPPLPAATQDILLSYFRDRACPVPAWPRPTWRSTTATVLSAGPSAPGPDGLPYEVYQVGSSFAAALAAQAQYARAG
eukprot:15142072-Alexandrium_andersonii.AAC.1